MTLRPSWTKIFLAFRRAHGGCDPVRQSPDGWLYLAEEAERRGRPDLAATYLEAGLVSEAYDADCCDPPAALAERYLPA